MATSGAQVMEITMGLRVSSPALVAMSCKEAQLESASTIWGGQEWSQPVHVSEYFTTLPGGIQHNGSEGSENLGRGCGVEYSCSVPEIGNLTSSLPALPVCTYD